MLVTVLTPAGKVFEGEAESLILPAIDGEMGILKNHAPLIAALGSGKLELRLEEGIQNYQISEGIVEVNQNVINILTEKAVA